MLLDKPGKGIKTQVSLRSNCTQDVLPTLLLDREASRRGQWAAALCSSLFPPEVASEADLAVSMESSIMWKENLGVHSPRQGKWLTMYFCLAAWRWREK